MQKLPAFVAVFALSLIALLVWLFSGSEADSPLSGSADADPATADSTAEPHPAEAARLPTETGTAAPDPTRITVGTDAAATGPALVGQVVDAQGRPVAGATVRALAGLRAAIDPARLAAGGLEALQAGRGRDQRVEVDTDASGRFRIRPPGATGTIELRVLARGYAELRQDAERPLDTDRDLGTLELRSGAIVGGRVVDATGQPLADADVRLRTGERESPFGALDLPIDLDLLPGTGERTRTDRDGRFEFAHAAAGSFGLRVRHPEHPPARLDGLSVAAGEALADLLVVVEPGASIAGKLVGVPDGVDGLRVMAAEPRTGAGNGADGALAIILEQAGEALSQSGLDAGLGERSASVAEDGSFVLRGLRVGRAYQIWAVQTGRGIRAIQACSPRLEVLSGAAGVQLRYEVGIEVSFAVVDAATGAPIESLSVRDRLVDGGDPMGALLSMGGIATSVAFPRSYPDGRVTLADLRPRDRQKLDVTIKAPGYVQFERRGIELPTSGSLDLGVIRLDTAPRLRVEVVGADGAPVAGARVRVRTERDGTGRDGDGSGPGGIDLERVRAQLGDAVGGRGGTRTDAAGRCEIDLADDRPFVVSVRAEGFAPYQSDTLRVEDRAGIDHTVRLLRGGRVEVTVLEADGSPAAAADVDHRGEAGARGRARTDATGLAVFEGLAAGEHRFRIGGRGPGAGARFEVAQLGGRGIPDGAGWEAVRVTDGETASLRLSKSASASLSGIVTVDGAPLSGARVSFQKGRGADGAAAGIEDQVMAALGGMGGGRGSRSRTDEAGRYRFDDVAAGEHRLRITHRDRAMPTEIGIVLRSGENTLDIALDTTTLRGTVLDAEGRPVAGATLRIAMASSDVNDPSAAIAGALEGALGNAFGGAAGRGGRPQARTDADGRFELRGVRGGESVVVTASANGFAPTRSAPVTTPVGGVMDGIEIRLTAAGSVRVRVANARPFASVQASFQGDESAPPVIQMLQRGSGTLEGLRPGPWRITLLAPGQDMSNPPTRNVEVRAGTVIELDF